MASIVQLATCKKTLAVFLLVQSWLVMTTMTCTLTSWLVNVHVIMAIINHDYTRKDTDFAYLNVQAKQRIEYKKLSSSIINLFLAFVNQRDKIKKQCAQKWSFLELAMYIAIHLLLHIFICLSISYLFFYYFIVQSIVIFFLFCLFFYICFLS